MSDTYTGDVIYTGRIEAALRSGTPEQVQEKIIAFLARTAGRDLGKPTLANMAEDVERLVMFDRPGMDPRG